MVKKPIFGNPHKHRDSRVPNREEKAGNAETMHDCCENALPFPAFPIQPQKTGNVPGSRLPAGNDSTGNAGNPHGCWKLRSRFPAFPKQPGTLKTLVAQGIPGIHSYGERGVLGTPSLVTFV
jgi:hypothetical protein